MAANPFQDHDGQSQPLVQTVGIIYCTSSANYNGREAEKIADCEVIEVANAVQAALVAMGYEAELVDLDPLRITNLKKFDWIFNLAESIYGFPLADHDVARLLEQENISFTGSGSAALKVCLDKALTKCQLLRNRIDTPAFEVFAPGSSILNLLEYPLIVKPAHEDGSIGISGDSIVHNTADLETQVRKIHQFYKQAALVERFIEGRDITASVIGNRQEAVVLPLSEIIYPQEIGPKFLTFDAKWMPDTLDYKVTAARCPCILDPEVEDLVKGIALRSYQVMGCRDYARVDFRLDGKSPYVLEVNPNPCINPDDSGFVRSARASGLSYVQMVGRILESAVKDRSKIPNTTAMEERNATYIT